MNACDSKISPFALGAIAFNSLICLWISVILVLLPGNSLWAAGPVAGGQAARQEDAGAVPPGQIGDSGYVVPVPEINMKSIIGGRAPTPGQPRTGPAKESPATKEPAAVEESTPPARAPVPVTEESTPQIQAPTSTPERKPVPPKELSDESPEPDEVVRLPFDPSYRTGPARARKAVPPVQAAPDKKVESPLASPPVAPEETLEAKPPKKEVVKQKVAASIPNLLESSAIKGTSKAIPIDRATMDTSGDVGDGIALGQRKEPEELPVDTGQPSTKVAGVVPPEPLAPEPKKQETRGQQPSKLEPPAAEPQEPEFTEEIPRPEDRPSAEETPTTPLVVASPLVPDTLGSRDVKDYLTLTAPILEELSLLMAKAPSLAIADFDPSDPNAAIFPKEIYVKIDAMKRELQVLDSKAFAIIPPTKYAPFHSVIRESIIHTYQACDAMINYFNERNDENLQKVHDHLIKARELVQKTHLAQG